MSQELKSTIEWHHVDKVKAAPGQAGKGHTIKRMIGRKVGATSTIDYVWNEYEPGVREPLHWHESERAYYIVSGHAVLTDIRGKKYDIDPETVIYAPAGINGSHAFEAKTGLKLVEINAWADIDGPGMPWILVDPVTKESTVDLENILKFGRLNHREVG